MSKIIISLICGIWIKRTREYKDQAIKIGLQNLLTNSGQGVSKEWNLIQRWHKDSGRGSWIYYGGDEVH